MPRPHEPIRCEIAVIGAGPSGLSLACALAERGADVVTISPEWPAPWPNNYGVWRSEMERYAPDLLACASHTWEQPVVWIGDEDAPRTLERAYMKFDNHALRQHFTQRYEAHNGRHLAAFATKQVTHTDTESHVVCRDGQRVEAALIIDASGHSPLLVERGTPDAPGYQIAYGVRAEIVRGAEALASMSLMDWRLPAPDASEDVRADPSFLYVMPLGDNEVFVEETSLVGRPAVSMVEMERRLWRRLERMGVHLGEALEIERCRIPMGHALPRTDTRVVGWGGAASMVHPATGYQVARAFSWAPETASRIAEALGDGARGAALSQVAHDAVWTPQRRQQRRLYMYGMEALLRLDYAGVCDFFLGFFSLPSHLWGGYLSSDLTPGQMAQMMLKLFGASSPTMRWEMVKPALGAQGLELMRGLIGVDRINAWRRTG